jgi:hypothetical protein
VYKVIGKIHMKLLYLVYRIAGNNSTRFEMIIKVIIGSQAEKLLSLDIIIKVKANFYYQYHWVREKWLGGSLCGAQIP